MTLSRIERIEADGKFIVVADLSDPSSIQKKDFKSASTDTILSIDKQHYYASFCYPLSLLPVILELSKRCEAAKKVHTDTCAEIYKLNNKLSRGEI